MSSESITWRPATPDDVGRLARFRNSEDEAWRYDVIRRYFIDLEPPNTIQWECGCNLFETCEVQDVPPRIAMTKDKVTRLKNSIKGVVNDTANFCHDATEWDQDFWVKAHERRPMDNLVDSIIELLLSAE